MSARAVVFAYHNVGVRCLQVLLARGVEVALVVTHEDDPAENIWFGSVRSVAREHGIPVMTGTAPADPKSLQLHAAVAAARPDFIFSFYYRHMLPTGLLALAARGAYNLHGSLLPKYRGRAPTNWAVLNGETETGATLHEMAAKPDAGAIVAQTAVPILPDDTAAQVFDKVTVAAEQTLWRVLPALLAGAAPRLPNDLSQGSYYGGRRPEDGRIDWTRPAQQVYNLIRAVAPPYPGAFTDVGGARFVIARARLALPAPHGSCAPSTHDAPCAPSAHAAHGAHGARATCTAHDAHATHKACATHDARATHDACPAHDAPTTARAAHGLPPGIHVSDNALLGVCGDGRAIVIHELRRRSPRDGAHGGNLTHAAAETAETVIAPAAFAEFLHSVPRS